MLFQDLNGNYQYGESSSSSTNQCHQTLPSIFEGRSLHNVSDISLECDETIDNWEELESCIFSNKRNEKFHVYEETSQDAVGESFEFYNDYPPPNSPAKGVQVDQPVLQLHSQYVNSLLKVWRDSQKRNCSTEESGENSDGYSLSPDELQSSQESNESSQDCEMATESETIEAILASNTIVQEHSDSAQMEQLHGLPESQSSSRSTSPTVMEMLSHFRQNVMNFRSISPIVVRSPTPVSSGSSSPGFVRSPSPLEFLEHSMSSLPIDDSTELVFYDNRYIVRSYSPVSYSQGDHQVPDVNMDFQQTVSDSEEFPSFRSYSHIRIQNSCQDQVVPDYIEE
ncbi:uncharacterized protein LOC123545177 [Mercenaria mercenaria]|uniref:uncharacterized protein LOC123545177 n=1 Tax=Mercenaria mercenaria TaxID=6596 RepID=UPI00234F568D|nr:uncharacterized protein LOC123545177 [Mercenaria mercenaria]